MPTQTKPRTLSQEQKATMALAKARKTAIDAGLPDPFPSGVPGTKEFAANTASPAVPALTATPPAVAPAQPIAPLPAPSAPIATPNETLAPIEPPSYGPHDIVRVFNPDNEDFHFRYGTKAQYDAKGKVIESTIEPIMYTLAAGKAIPMHGYMADYVCNHLTSRILQKIGKVRQLNSPVVRKAWAAKIILGKEDIITPEAKLSEAEQVRKEFDKIQVGAANNPVSEDESEIPLAEADDLLNDMDKETLTANGSEFPDANSDITA